MGVSAVFVSALALTRLPVPASPPENQPQFLAATIQPIVSFVVLGSIIVHGLSIPFFNISREVRTRTASLTVTWTQTRTWMWSNRTQGGGIVPDWALWVRRLGDDETGVVAGTGTTAVRNESAIRSEADLENGSEASTEVVPIITPSVSMPSNMDWPRDTKLMKSDGTKVLEAGEEEAVVRSRGHTEVCHYSGIIGITDGVMR